jgi:hypothetical protein
MTGRIEKSMGSYDKWSRRDLGVLMTGEGKYQWATLC